MGSFLKWTRSTVLMNLTTGLFCLLVCGPGQKLNAQMQLSITNSSITQLPGDSVSISINYTLVLPYEQPTSISLQSKPSESSTFYVDLAGATGDVGEDITSGNDKRIEWTGAIGSGMFDLILNANQAVEVDVIDEILSQIDSTRMRADLENIEGIRHRTAGVEQLALTQSLIRARLQGYNIPLDEQRFSFSPTYEATNFIGRQNGCGQSEAVWLIGGHYDTVDDSPGADDNGTAIVGMLEAARILSGYQFEKSIAYVAWDLEEEGLLGSIDFVSKNQDSFGDIEGYMNFEMIGYFSNRANTQMFPPGFDQLFPEQEQAVANDAFRGNFIANVGNTQNSFELMESFEAMASQYVPDLKVISIPAPGTGAIVPDLRRSDHTPFWLANIPSIMITDSANFRNENYHGPEDVLDSLNYTFMTNVVKATVATIVNDARPTVCVSENTLLFLTPNSTQEVFDNKALTVFPNPTSDQLTLQLDGNKRIENKAVSIYAMDGRLLLQSTYSTGDKIDLNDLANGQYHLILQESEQSYSTSFIIQR